MTTPARGIVYFDFIGGIFSPRTDGQRCGALDSAITANA
jgi:hypothetical protein